MARRLRPEQAADLVVGDRNRMHGRRGGNRLLLAPVDVARLAGVRASARFSLAP